MTKLYLKQHYSPEIFASIKMVVYGYFLSSAIHIINGDLYDTNENIHHREKMNKIPKSFYVSAVRRDELGSP